LRRLTAECGNDLQDLQDFARFAGRGIAARVGAKINDRMVRQELSVIDQELARNYFFF
jgi:hypothetical protein